MIQEGVLLPIPTPLASSPVDEVNWQNHQSCRNSIEKINSNAMILMDVPPGLLCKRGQPGLQGLALAQQRRLELVHERGPRLIAEGSTKRREKLNLLALQCGLVSINDTRQLLIIRPNVVWVRSDSERREEQPRGLFLSVLLHFIHNKFSPAAYLAPILPPDRRKLTGAPALFQVIICDLRPMSATQGKKQE